MTRHHKSDLAYVWRAVITHRWPNGNEQIEYCGPYTAKGHIRSEYGYFGAENSIVYQRAKLDWETVEES